MRVPEPKRESKSLRERLAPVVRLRFVSNAAVRVNRATHRTLALPILLFAPTSRCNSRCVSCDWWRTDGATDLRSDEVAVLAREISSLGTKLVVFTGGEPLVRDDVFDLADMFLREGAVLHLLTSGLALEKHAEEVARRFSAVTVSLDGHTSALYRRIRGVDGLAALERGVRRLRELRPDLPVRARSTLHRHNFTALSDLIAKARAMGLSQISFLAADASSDSFGRRVVATTANERLLLTREEADELERAIDEAQVVHAGAFRDHFVAESVDKLRRVPAYYRAHAAADAGAFPPVSCDAPWASAVVEADGTVRPCFFQPPVGNLRSKSLRALLDSEMVQFRRGLDVGADTTCQRCVCSLRVGPRSRIV